MNLIDTIVGYSNSLVSRNVYYTPTVKKRYAINSTGAARWRKAVEGFISSLRAFTRIQAEDLRLAIHQIVSDQHLFNHCDTKPLDRR